MKEIKEKKGVTYKKGYRKDVMDIILTCGCLSRKGIRMLGEDNFKQYLNKIKEMKDEGLIEEIRVLSRHEGYHKTLRLVNVRPTTEKYMDFFPMHIGHYYRYGVNNAASLNLKKKKRAIKAYRESEIVCMLAGTDTRTSPDKKISVREKKAIPLYPPSFYNSLEIREGGGYKLRITDEAEEKQDIVSSRIIGLLLSEGGQYGIYHTEDKEIKWQKSSEGQMVNTIAKLINERCVNVTEEEKEDIEHGNWNIKKREAYENVPITKISRITESILVGSADKAFISVLNNSSAGKINLYECGYERMYAVPYIKEGQKLIDLMLRKDWQAKMKSVYLKGFNTNTRSSSVTCDATYDDKFVLLFCIPDLVKLKKFINNASYMGEPEKFIVYCFDFQEEFIESAVGDLAEIRIVSFKEYWEHENEC